MPPYDGHGPGPPNGLPEFVTSKTAKELRYRREKKVGDYWIGRSLGQGSFAKVKEGMHVPTGEKVAIKIIDKVKARKDDYTSQNLRREARLMKMLCHPNILHLLEELESMNTYYLITELAEGGDLLDYVTKRKHLPEDEVRRYIAQIASAVHHIHQAGIVHRDLKIENLLLDADHNIKLIDFGLSNTIEPVEPGTFRENHCRTQCGSPAYAAPELHGKEEYGFEVDVWSIGIIVFAMLTGSLPYTVEPYNLQALRAKMLSRRINKIPAELNISNECLDLLYKLLDPCRSTRITVLGILCHPWLQDAPQMLLAPLSVSHKLTMDDLDDRILEHMCSALRMPLAEVTVEVLQNSASQYTATYHLLAQRLARYERTNASRKSNDAKFEALPVLKHSNLEADTQPEGQGHWCSDGDLSFSDSLSLPVSDFEESPSKERDSARGESNLTSPVKDGRHQISPPSKSPDSSGYITTPLSPVAFSPRGSAADKQQFSPTSDSVDKPGLQYQDSKAASMGQRHSGTQAKSAKFRQDSKDGRGFLVESPLVPSSSGSPSLNARRRSSTARPGELQLGHRSPDIPRKTSVPLSPFSAVQEVAATGLARMQRDEQQRKQSALHRTGTSMTPPPRKPTRQRGKSARASSHSPPDQTDTKTSKITADGMPVRWAEMRRDNRRSSMPTPTSGRNHLAVPDAGLTPTSNIQWTMDRQAPSPNNADGESPRLRKPRPKDSHMSRSESDFSERIERCSSPIFGNNNGAKETTNLSASDFAHLTLPALSNKADSQLQAKKRAKSAVRPAEQPSTSWWSPQLPRRPPAATGVRRSHSVDHDYPISINVTNPTGEGNPRGQATSSNVRATRPGSKSPVTGHKRRLSQGRPGNVPDPLDIGCLATQARELSDLEVSLRQEGVQMTTQGESSIPKSPSALTSFYDSDDDTVFQRPTPQCSPLLPRRRGAAASWS